MATRRGAEGGESGNREMLVHRRLYELSGSGEVSFSFEFFVPDTSDGLDDLRPRVDRLASTEPAFVDVVAVGGLAAARRALRLCAHTQKVDGVPAMLHVTCADMTVEDTRALLNEAVVARVLNILVERGVSEATPPVGAAPVVAAPPAPPRPTLPTANAATQPPGRGGGGGTALEAALRAGTLAHAAGPALPPGVITASTPALSPLMPATAGRPAFVPTPGGFEHAADAVAWIRAEYGATFCIGVMGYPCGHGEYGSAEAEAEALRAKVAAGADFILAQHVHEARTFLDFRDGVARAGMGVPVLPSVMPVQSYDTFLQVNAYAGVPLPPSLASTLASLAEDKKAVREFGNRHVVALMRDLVAAGVPVLHLHTLNLEAVIRSVLQDVGLCGPGAGARRKLPWRPSGDAARRRTCGPFFGPTAPPPTCSAPPGGRCTRPAGGAARTRRAAAGAPLWRWHPSWWRRRWWTQWRSGAPCGLRTRCGRATCGRCLRGTWRAACRACRGAR